MQCEIVYEDQEILVIHKPSGLATQSAGVGQMDVVSELKAYLSRQMDKQEKKPPYLGIIHRLDQPVEGLLVFAKTTSSAAALTKQLGSGELNKQYLAVVLGRPDEDACLTDYLRKDKDRAQVVTEQQEKYPDAKVATLRYKVLKTAESFLHTEISLLRVQIETGRFHQIRAQLSHAGYPILGDRKYAVSQSMELSKALQIQSVLLCADKLQIIHPGNRKKMEWTISPSWEKMFSML